MLKMLRQLKGDSPDTAKVRAEAYDELREVEHQATLWAKLSDIADFVKTAVVEAVSDRVTTIENYFNGTNVATSLTAQYAKILSPVEITSGDISQILELGAGIYKVTSAVTGIPTANTFHVVYIGSKAPLASAYGTLLLFGFPNSEVFTARVGAGKIYYGTETATSFSTGTWKMIQDSYADPVANYLVATEAKRNIKVKSGTFTATAVNKLVTFSSSFPKYGFFAMVESNTETPKIAFCGSTGIAVGDTLTIGNTYNWIAFGW